VLRESGRERQRRYFKSAVKAFSTATRSIERW
jgi:hypothetical protein